MIRKLTVILAGFSVIVLWLILVSYILQHLQNSLGEWNRVGNFVSVVIFAPLWEELVYRHAALQIAKKLNKSLKKNFIPSVIIISSAAFGWGHGEGQVSLLLQGMYGVVLCYVYIENGFSYWSSVTVHALLNLSVCYLFPYLFPLL